MNVDLKSDVKFIGMAAFLHAAISYVKNTSIMRKKLEKNDLNLKLALIATDLPNAALIIFEDKQVAVKPLAEKDWENINKWDIKIEGDCQTFFDYFMGRLGAVRPILFRKLKTTPYLTGSLKLLKVLWFVKTSVKLFTENISLSEAMFYKFYNYGQEKRKLFSEQEGDKFGYNGKILWVDLDKMEVKEEEPDTEIYQKYLGGYGLGAYYIYNRIKPDSDPLGPENILGFCPGLLTGTTAPFSGRYMICAKSPLTGGWGDANSGGRFGPAIKKSGYDAIFFTGKAEKPVYLLIEEDNIELISASEIWGKDVVETENTLTEKYGRCDIASIGLGGENRSLISGIVNDSSRIAARSGLGAVMGSKNLKAICITGKQRLNIANKEEMMKLTKSYIKKINNKKNDFIISYFVKLAPSFARLLRLTNIHYSNFKISTLYAQFLAKIGTPFFYGIMTNVGDAPIKNYTGVAKKEFQKKRYKKMDGSYLQKYYSGSVGCYACPLRCGAKLSIPEYDIEDIDRPEYETLAAFSGLILNDDLKSILLINDYLNRQGIDTISCGGVVAFTLECVEKGLLKKEDFKCKEYPEGFLPKWNESEYILTLCKMIAKREGIGDILADGVKKAAKEIKDSKKFAIHAGGQELPMHDARLTKGLMLTYVTDPTPGRHTAASADYFLVGPGNNFLDGFKVKTGKKPKKKGKAQAKTAKFIQSFNSLGLCMFSEWCGKYPLLEMIKAITGWNLSVEDLLEIGWRIQTLRQMFNAREGAIRHDISKRAIGDPPMKKGPLKGNKINVEEMAQYYYENIGFKEDGIPKKETLEELDLDFCVSDLSDATGRPESVVNESL
ncbi:MAG: aldehyde ferredoxin oxidoreductase [Candidatus Lokiarchaeota archaeon]|nr:aldehyde ferredoxin oxidoreductase [Candidatus Lokiarchaeota archaeon]